MENESMVFYKSFYEAIKGLQVNIKAELYDAIVHYGLYEEDLQLSEKAMPYYILIKPQLVANLKRRKNGAYGQLGGRPKKEKPNGAKEKPIGFSEMEDGFSEIKPNGLSKDSGWVSESENPNPQKNNPNVNVNVNVNNKEKYKKKKPFGSYPASETDYSSFDIYAN